MSTRRVIDVSDLPHHGFDTIDPVWWGNNGLLCIETSMFMILIATYFYLRQNFLSWPPPLGQLTGPLDPLPDLLFGTTNTVVLLVSLLAAGAVDIAARRNYREVTLRCQRVRLHRLVHARNAFGALTYPDSRSFLINHLVLCKRV